MSQLVLERGNSLKMPFWARFISRLSLGPYFLVFSLIAFSVLVTVITLIFSTRQVTKGYVLNSLDDKKQSLVMELEVNDMEISKVKSLSYIENSAKVDSMVRPRDIVFLEGEVALASR